MINILNKISSYGSTIIKIAGMTMMISFSSSASLLAVQAAPEALNHEKHDTAISVDNRGFFDEVLQKITTSKPVKSTEVMPFEDTFLKMKDIGKSPFLLHPFETGDAKQIHGTPEAFPGTIKQEQPCIPHGWLCLEHLMRLIESGNTPREVNAVSGNDTWLV